MKWVYDMADSYRGMDGKGRRQSAANIGALAHQVDTPGPLFPKTCLENVWVT